MKKKLAVLTVGMSLALLAGCGNAAADTNSSAASSAVTESSVAAESSSAESSVAESASAGSDEVVDPKAEFEALKEHLIYQGGLYVSQPDNDLQLAIFRNDGDPVVLVSKLGDFYYGMLNTEDGKLEDGTEYVKVKFEGEGKTFGYIFNEDMSGFLIDEDGTKIEAKEMAEEAALDMVKYSLGVTE